MTDAARNCLVKRVRRDLVGPQGGPDELISAYPTDQYLAGILYPKQDTPNLEDEEALEVAGAGGDDEGESGQSVPAASMRRPSSMGISFSLEAQVPRVVVRGSAGRYERFWEVNGELTKTEGKKQDIRWQRYPLTLSLDIELVEGIQEAEVTEVPGLRWFVRGYKTGDANRWQGTVVLFNELDPAPGRPLQEEACFFQVGFEVSAGKESRLVPRPAIRGAAHDADEETNALIYRKAAEWAVGHTCSAAWACEEEETVDRVFTEWLPSHVVPAMNPEGHPVFQNQSMKRAGTKTGSFDAEQLAEAPEETLCKLLEAVPEAYLEWLDSQEARLKTEDFSGLLDVAKRHLKDARALANRMQQGIELIRTDPKVRTAFQLSQAVMLQQRRWDWGADANLLWRPFQLGFQLLTLVGIASPADDRGTPSQARRVMDLLWFPTGGGKTEAYLGLIAFTLFHRRLRHGNHADAGAGVTVLMRYTLRLLTIQQFERATRMILACERIRSERSDLGEVPFSIGLWVGNSATPGKVKDARLDEGKKKARQLTACPACKEDSLWWDCEPRTDEFLVRCDEKKSPGCVFAGKTLPIWTIDEEIYRNRPSLVIGTIDKFAQVVRKQDTGKLFGAGSPQLPPPELIIQDELHLISGPLGTISGIYESAIDQLCTHEGVPPKIVGSTATIRRADDQVMQLFGRPVCQFPPPVLDADDSCFAVVNKEAPGRLYVGLSTAGRSPKFTLQASYATLLQNASEPVFTDDERDPYWTLVAYFNSLRELGGALVMLRDDVPDSIGTYAALHGEDPRSLEEEPLELTSRVPSEEIPQALKDLEETSADGDAVDAVLATNMISVGMDIRRLGLMVVTGQPKSMAEYIQATSRVGRGMVAGLVLTVYNAGRPRDRSHFEGFKTWHQTLYREVEAMSVTPFAPRARDRALHAALVALARHKLAGMGSEPLELTESLRLAMEPYVDQIVARADAADPDEAAGVREDADRYLVEWRDRGRLDYYWNDFVLGNWKNMKDKSTLLVSAEAAAAQKAVKGTLDNGARPTPNSMRGVEPSVAFRMTEVLKPGGRTSG